MRVVNLHVYLAPLDSLLRRLAPVIVQRVLPAPLPALPCLFPVPLARLEPTRLRLALRIVCRVLQVITLILQAIRLACLVPLVSTKAVQGYIHSCIHIHTNVSK